MAPEVFRHEPYTMKVDQYAYSMILYYMFEGVPARADMHPVELARDAALSGLRPIFFRIGRTTEKVSGGLYLRFWGKKSKHF